MKCTVVQCFHSAVFGPAAVQKRMHVRQAHNVQEVAAPLSLFTQVLSLLVMMLITAAVIINRKRNIQQIN